MLIRNVVTIYIYNDFDLKHLRTKFVFATVDSPVFHPTKPTILIFCNVGVS